MAKTAITQVKIKSAAHDRLSAYCEKNGMFQIEVISRLVDWFCDQSPEVQGVVQKHYPVDMSPEIAAAFKGATRKSK